MAEAAARASGTLKQYQLDAVIDGQISPEKPEVLFKDLEAVGHGAYADVFKALDLRNNEVVAIKKFKKKSREEFDDILKEIKFLKGIKSPHLTNLKGAFFSTNNKVWIVMDFCQGSVFDAIQALKSPLYEAEIRDISFNVLKGLEYLHNSEKIHRDIKAKNILVSDNGVVKLADFGTSADLSKKDGRCNSFVGSPYWIAPEVIMAMDTGTYSYPVDIWSFGIFVIEMAEMNPPLFEMQSMSALYHIPQRDPPTLKADTWSTEFRAFLARCVAKDPVDRGTATSLLADPFLTQAPQTTQHTINNLIVRTLAAVQGHTQPDISRIAELTVNAGAASPAAETEASNNDELESVAEEEDGAESVAAPSLSAEQEATVRAQKYNTLKMPTRRAVDVKESKLSVLVEGQMKALRKLQKKLTDEKKLLEKKQRIEETQLRRRLNEQLDDLRRIHDRAESMFAQEREKALSELQTQQQRQRRVHEKDVDKFAREREKESNRAIHDRAKELQRAHEKLAKDERKTRKDEHKRDKATMETRAKDDFEAKKATYIASASKVFRAQQEMEEAQLKHKNLTDELDMKEKHLRERIELAAANKTGDVHHMMKEHLEQKHVLESQYQTERHALEKQHLDDEHDAAHESIRKRQATQSRSAEKKLKKLSLFDPEVQETFEASTRNVPELRDLDDRKSTVDRAEAKKLDKLKKEGLKAARSEVISIATVRLSEEQLKEMNRLKRLQAEEVATLGRNQAAQRENMEMAHRAAMAELDTRMEQERDAADKYKAMELNHFLAARKDTIERAQAKLDGLVEERTAIVNEEQNRISNLGAEWHLP